MQRHLKLLHDLISGRPAHLRSPEWHRVEREHLERQPECRWCGATAGLLAHHVKPFHLAPALELEPGNLITLCEEGEYNCHLVHGHNGDWKSFNDDVREQCEVHRKGHEWALLEAIRSRDSDLYKWLVNNREIERKKNGWRI